MSYGKNTRDGIVGRPLEPADFRRPLEAVVDETKAAMLRDMLARVESGEQFTVMAILATDGYSIQIKDDGSDLSQLLLAASRMVYLINKRMDENNEDSEVEV